eukprot:TRINITY_DN1439_c0_g1_i2.p1 TRINITY_DN1439_c0_g1~~TRINITY_DN1439_c0_g1_i2.p1  ORF type:complete len:173 (-),score=45.01 TRINITY_DN1439_c0_g1_i2:38-556(-)
MYFLSYTESCNKEDLCVLMLEIFLLIKFRLFLTLAGFVDMCIDGSIVTAVKPALSGGSDKISWDLNAGDNEIMDVDDLVQPSDFIKPNIDCGSAGKVRTACADCTCGLAEQLEGEKKSTLTLEMLENPGVGSSCGSCSLGDAFRCPGCPYRGLPAFTPGEKIELPDDFMVDM